MAKQQPHGAPKVFISSTINDLKPFRDAARQAAIATGFFPVMSEDWTAKDKPALDECLKKVDETHLTIAIVAHRYGFVPECQEDHKSITWLECLHTKEKNKRDLLAFPLNDQADWPVEKKEEFRLTKAMIDGASQEKIQSLTTEIQKNITSLKAFKIWLSKGRIHKSFSTTEDIRRDVAAALQEWLKENPTFQAQANKKTSSNPERYLQALYNFTANIDIRGLAIGGGKAHRFSIGDLYVELSTTAGGSILENIFSNKRLVIIGDPGSGKTTSLRWISNNLCSDLLGYTEESSIKNLGLSKEENTYLPLFVSINDWLEYINESKQQGNEPHPKTSKDPQWLTHYLSHLAESHEQGLDREWFREKLNAGTAILLLDGLDEATDRQNRELTVALIDAIATTWLECPIVVTSRPAAYLDKSVLLNFETTYIEPLNDNTVKTFITHWSKALHQEDPQAAETHQQDLLSALYAKPTIRRLARNTIMLTALAVVHWNDKRLPEQRAELYESILTWLARSRELRDGRRSPEICLELLRTLALAMQNNEQGRLIQLPRRQAAEFIASQFDGDINSAEKFLEEEELDSGIIVRRGTELCFWHLTFQEYLAARAVAGLSEKEQHIQLLGNKRYLYTSEWREVILLLGGVLYEQGRAKVDGLMKDVLDDLENRTTTLADKGRTAGLLGGITRDLAPYKYEPTDKRYKQLLITVNEIFSSEHAKRIPIEVRIEAAEALGQAGDPRLVDEHQRWVSIPAGQFLMGAQKSDPKKPNYDMRASNNKPPQWVKLDSFQLARWPVTVAEFANFVEDDGYTNSKLWLTHVFKKWSEPKNWDKQLETPNRPVIYISWFEATAYCVWLTEQRRHLGLMNQNYVVRPPTEVEWEFAARGIEARRYPWGSEDTSPTRLNYAGNIGKPTPIGLYPEGNSPEGLMDMAGNIFEWCTDGYQKNCNDHLLKADNIYNSPTPDSDNGTILRGGCWLDGSDVARAAYRHWIRPSDRRSYVGFRLCCSSPI